MILDVEFSPRYSSQLLLKLNDGDLFLICSHRSRWPINFVTFDGEIENLFLPFPGFS